MVRRPSAELMRYYASPAAALDVVETLLPEWARGQAPLAAARAYFEAVPVDFSVFGFGLEYHLTSDRIDGGVALPLSRGRHELILDNLLELRERLGGDDRELWPARVLEPAQRVAALDPLDARMIQAFCLCMDGTSMQARRCPDLVYLSLRDLHRLRDPSQLLWSPAIERLVRALFGERDARGSELLARLARGSEAWPRVRLAHLGVARVEAGGSLKPYLRGPLDQIIRMWRSDELPRAPGFDDPLAVLESLAAIDGSSELTLLLGAGRALARVDIEVSPGPRFRSALALACARGVEPERAKQLEKLAAAGVKRVRIDDWAPVAMRLSHLKVSLRVGQAPSWKAYFVVRQAG